MAFHVRHSAPIVVSTVSLALAAVALAPPGLAAHAATTAAAAGGLSIQTLSTRADRVSGDSVLVGVDGVSAAGGGAVTLNGANVTPAFSPASQAGSLIGLVTGLKLGKNTLTVSQPGQESRTLEVTDYPITGPIVSGPRTTPFLCQTGSYLIAGTTTPYGPPQDADCSRPTTITYLYLPVGGTALVPMPSTTTLPADVATTTTTAGKTVKFVVRVETSTIDRGIYESAVLHDPTTEPQPSAVTPPKAWNSGLIGVAGFGCPGGWYQQGKGSGSLAVFGMDFSLVSPARLGEGYALFSNTMMNPSNNCNAVVSGEAAMMSKEHFIENYGVPRYTVGEGCSGGSYGNLQLADALPGLYDGILMACTFPDPLSIAISGLDGRLLYHYYVTHPGALTEAQVVAISGYKSLQAFTDAAAQSGRTDPVITRTDPLPGYVPGFCPPDLPAAQIYDVDTNPHGVRCDVFDAARNIYGTNPATGSALRPFDNVGVQYGLTALQAGVITPAQFLDLNENIGGYDQDANYVPARTTGDAGAIRRAFQSGLEFSGTGGAANIPIFDITGIYNDNGGYHYQWEHFAARDRLIQANGNADNEVMWRGTVPFDQAWSTFISWVQQVAGDTSAQSARAKVLADKPAAAKDGCWATATSFVAETQTFGTSGSTCNTTFPSYAFPRYVAGESVAANVLKCQVTAIKGTDYSGFSDADFTRLNNTFSSGVCDFSKPSVGSAPVVPHASFGPAPRNLSGTVTPNVQQANLVKAMYQDFLGRAPSQSELNGWVTVLSTGLATSGQLAQTLARSPEYTQQVVNRIYQEALGRPADPTGLAGWSAILQADPGAVAGVAAGIYGSPEFYALSGNDPATWVTSLYRLILLRDPDPAGLAAWTALVPTLGRPAISLGFYNSPEKLNTRVQVLYQDLLGRAADPTGLAAWPAVIAGQGDISLAATIASSAEYFNRAQTR